MRNMAKGGFTYTFGSIQKTKCIPPNTHYNLPNQPLDFLWVTPLYPKFYKPEFLLDVKSAPNYTKMLELIRISATTL
jgi:hypothetical protein